MFPENIAWKIFSLGSHNKVYSIYIEIVISSVFISLTISRQRTAISAVFSGSASVTYSTIETIVAVPATISASATAVSIYTSIASATAVGLSCICSGYI